MNAAVIAAGIQAGAGRKASAPPTLGLRIVLGLLGVLVASLVAGLNEHVIDIALPDVRGAMFIGHDEGTWITALYEAMQVSAMAFAPWCSATFSLRRFTLGATAVFALLGLLCPLAPNLDTLYALRGLQGLAGGCLPPMLMTVALRFLPPGIKLYGLGAYALTATFGPNLGTPLAALWTEYVGWRFVFWQIIPPCLLAMAAIAYGLPQDPLRLERLRQLDWRGVLLGLPAISALVIALELGTRMGWLDSPLICLLFSAGSVLLALFLINEWSHPLPFFKIQLLRRRNLAHSLITLGGVLLLLVAVPGIPSAYLAEVHGYRPLQIGSLALLVALPQLIALPAVAALCNMRRVDCRWVLAIGLGLISLSCYAGSHLTAAWIRDDFYLLQALQILGQPMAVIPLLMLATDGMTPLEGPFASAWFNTIKGFAAVLGTGLVEGLTTAREHFHSHVLIDQMGNTPQALARMLHDLSVRAGAGGDVVLRLFDGRIRDQALVLASADVYLAMAWVAAGLILLIPLVPTRVYPPRPVVDAPTR